jgi:hypothetical protein
VSPPMQSLLPRELRAGPGQLGFDSGEAGGGLTDGVCGVQGVPVPPVRDRLAPMHPVLSARAGALATTWLPRMQKPPHSLGYCQQIRGFWCGQGDRTADLPLFRRPHISAMRKS